MAEPNLQYWKLNSRKEIVLVMTDRKRRTYSSYRGVLRANNDRVLRQIYDQKIPVGCDTREVTKLFRILEEKFQQIDDDEDDEEGERAEIREWRFVSSVGKFILEWTDDNVKYLSADDIGNSSDREVLKQLSKLPLKNPDEHVTGKAVEELVQERVSVWMQEEAEEEDDKEEDDEAGEDEDDDLSLGYRSEDLTDPEE